MNLFAALTLTVATVFAVSNPASAACTRPAKISIPDGKTASEDAMKAAQARLTPYAKDMNVYLHCLADEIKNGKDEYEAVAADWTRQSEAFKNTPAPAK
jgi:hypothetical protein